MPAGGALGYLTVEPPRALSYGPPAVDSSWLANLPQQFQQGQQYARERALQTMFQPGTPGAAALAQSGIPANSLMGILAQAGGAQSVQGLLPALMGAQQLGQWNQQFGGAQGAQPTGQGTADAGGVQPSGADPRGLVPYIRSEAEKYGVNPNVAVRVAASEGLTSFYGDRGKSGGAFQLYTGGGLGNEFQKETGLNPLDPKNEKAAITWTLQNLARTGWSPYKGAAKVGIGPRTGIGQAERAIAQADTGPARSDQLNPTDRAAVDRIYSPSALAAPPGAPAVAAASQPGIPEPGVAQPATGAPAPVQQPEGAVGTAPFMASSSTNAAGPANVGGTAAAATMPRGAPTGVPADQQTRPPISPTSTAEVASNVGGGEVAAGGPGPPGASPSPGTAAGRDVVPQGQPAQRGFGIKQPGDTTQALRASEQMIQRMRTARPNMIFATPEQLKGLDERIAAEQTRHDQMLERINKENELSAGIQAEGPKKQAGVNVEQYSNLHKGLAGAGMTAANSYQYSQQALALVNNPNFYSGSMEQANLGIKRFLAGIGIDPGMAAPQEVFRKVMAANINQQINSLRAESEAMGEKGGRIFAPMIIQMEKAAQNPDNSIAANRYLTIFAMRNAQRTMEIANMADDYAQAHGSLDAGFEKQVRTWIAKNPVLSREEMGQPGSVGAPASAGGLAPPDVGTIINGHRFKGGNPRDKANWEPAA